MQINLVGLQQLKRVGFWGKEGSEGRDRRRANSGDREERERKEHVRRRWRDVGCSHRQAHSSCNACWDALGSVPHNTITACSSVLCSTPQCTDYVLLSFVRLPLFLLSCFPLCVLSSLLRMCLFSGRFLISLFFSFLYYILLNLLVELSANDQLKFFEQNISISRTFVVFFFVSFSLKISTFFFCN